jgi:uncharacterized protein (TIGR00725 family)
MAQVQRTYRVVIGVMGPAACDPATAELARAVGRGIAERGAVLLCGGRGGVMEAAAQGARGAGGLTIGVMPGEDARQSTPNAFIEVALFTGLGEARNWVNVCASDAIIAIGGGFGTLSEIALALKAKRPVVLVGSWRFDLDGSAPPLPRVTHATEAVETVFALLEAAGAPPKR